MERVNLGLDTSGRPLVLDTRTIAKLRAAEVALGFTFTIVQGSYRGGSGAAASAGTHDGGGVIDLRTWNLPASITPAKAVLELRLAGLIAWYRHEGQGFDPHIHAIDYGNPALAPSAASQVRMWEQGYNGLASWGRDDGPRVTIPQDPPTQEDPMADYAQQLDEIAADARAARRQSEKNGRLTYNRDVRILKGLGSLAEAVDALATQSKDDATKRQVRQVRSDIADLAASLEAPEGGDEAPRA